MGYSTPGVNYILPILFFLNSAYDNQFRFLFLKIKEKIYLGIIKDGFSW